MPRILERALSPTFVRTAPPGMHCDGRGLYLQVTERDDGKLNRSWVFRYRVAGRSRYAGLGPLATIGLSEAREKARTLRQERLDGIDPLEKRKSARIAGQQEAVAKAKTWTFDQCARAYIVAHAPGWRNAKHLEQWRNTLATYASPVFGALPVRDIDTALVRKALEPIWSTKPETASRLRGRIELVLDWAKVGELREGEDPARWRGHLDKLLPPTRKVRKVIHLAAMPYAEMPGCLAALREREGIVARALEFAVLTACRTGEILGAQWHEIDAAARLWTVPANRTKRQREHRVPLSSAALAVLGRMAAVRQSEYVFAGEREGAPLSSMALLIELRRMGHLDLTVHGFRSSFRDWAAERTNFPREIAEAALGHVVGDETERAYQRGDLLEKRRRLMEAWGEFLAKAPPAGKVIPMTAGTRPASEMR
jgi:integrase